MNNIVEINAQSKVDLLSKLYLFMAEAILARGGKGGEKVIRRAVQAYGEDLGTRLREQYIAAGVKVDLDSLAAAGFYCGTDPRFVRHFLGKDSDQQAWEVYNCPFYQIWNQYGNEAVGSYFCEEFIHALLAAYTQGEGQANVSNYMTRSLDQRCVFALYYRQANMNPENKKYSRGADTNEVVFDPGECFATLFYWFLRTAEELMGRDGLSAIQLGLRRLCRDITEYIYSKSKIAYRKLDEEFVRDFLVDPIHCQVWDRYPDNGAKKLIEQQLVGPIQKIFRGDRND